MRSVHHGIVHIAVLAAPAAVDTRPWLLAASGAGILSIVLGTSQVDCLGGG